MALQGPGELGHPAPMLLPSSVSMVCRERPVPCSVGSAAHTGLFIVGSHGAGAPWQRRTLHRSWCQEGRLHGDPVHGLGWVFIYLLVCSALL